MTTTNIFDDLLKEGVRVVGGVVQHTTAMVLTDEVRDALKRWRGEKDEPTDKDGDLLVDKDGNDDSDD